MRYILLITSFLCLNFCATAQKSKIVTARLALKDNDLDRAKAAIDAAIANPETSTNPDAWFTRGLIFDQMMKDTLKYGTKTYREAATSYLKVAELKPKYEDLKNGLIGDAFNYYNDGIGDYNAHQYDAAFQEFKQVIALHDAAGGNLFIDQKQFDTVLARAKLYEAYSASNGTTNKEAAVQLFEELKSNPIVRDPNVFLLLSDLYHKQNKEAQAISAIQEGEKLFPGNTNLTNEELSYYKRNGQTDVLLTKLEKAVAADPNNKDLLATLSNIYQNAAFPADANGKVTTKPANYNTLIANAETTLSKLVALEPNKPDYQYNFGSLYYNQATLVIPEMNKLGNSAADQKKYATLKVERDALLKKSEPYFLAAYKLLEPTAGNLSADDKDTYRNSLKALGNINNITGNTAKAEEYFKISKAIK